MLSKRLVLILLAAWSHEVLAARMVTDVNTFQTDAIGNHTDVDAAVSCPAKDVKCHGKPHSLPADTSGWALMTHYTCGYTGDTHKKPACGLSAEQKIFGLLRTDHRQEFRTAVNKLAFVKGCKGNPSFPKLKSGRCLVVACKKWGDRSKECKVKRLIVEADHLLPIVEVKSRLGSSVGDWFDFTDPDVQQGGLQADIFNDDFQFPLMNSLANSAYSSLSQWKHPMRANFQTQLQADANAIGGFNDRYRMLLEEKHKQQLDAIRALEVSKQALLRNSIVKLLESLQPETHPSSCKGQLTDAGDLQLLNESRDEHRETQAEEIQELATGLGAIAVNGLMLAADALVPAAGQMIGAGAEAFEKSIRALRELGKDFQMYHTLETTWNQISKDAYALHAKVDEHFDAVGGLEDSELNTSSLEEAEQELVLSYRAVAERVKQVLVDSLTNWFASAKVEGVWTAITYLPVIGPTIAMTRNAYEMVETARGSFLGQEEYLSLKDATLRNLFRMRDCTLTTFATSSIIESVVHAEDVKGESLFAAIDALTTAAKINDDLASRLVTRVKRFGTYMFSADEFHHESVVMHRLKTRQKKVLQTYVTIPPQNEDDIVLPEYTMKPSLWHQSLGSGIQKSYNCIHDVVKGGVASPHCN